MAITSAPISAPVSTAPPTKKSQLDSLYESYKLDPSQDNLRAVVDMLQPTINYSVNSINSGTDALIKNKAKILAAEAVRKYDPQFGAALPTWVSGQLMQLRRFKRSVGQPVQVPERIQLDAYALHRAEQSFIDKHDREPDLHELADAANMPVRRIQKVRNSFRATPSEAGLGDTTAGIATDFSDEAVDYVYRDADRIDRKIIEMKTGYGGKYPHMEPKHIAIRLGLSPSQLTRRSTKLTLRIQDIERDLQDVQ